MTPPQTSWETEIYIHLRRPEEWRKRTLQTLSQGLGLRNTQERVIAEKYNNNTHREETFSSGGWLTQALYPCLLLFSNVHLPLQLHHPLTVPRATRHGPTSRPVVALYCCVTNQPNLQPFKTVISFFYSHRVPVDQESGSSLAKWFCLSVSYEMVVKVPAGP